jgi:hypothetical protein
MCGSSADGAGAPMASGRRRRHDEVRAEVTKMMERSTASIASRCAAEVRPEVF